MADVREHWRSGRVSAIAYDSIVEREGPARVFGRAIWGSDTRRLFADIDKLGEAPDGSAILDVPCGGGLAFRGLRAEQDVRYVAADLSNVMLERAAREAERRGLEHRIEFLEADVEALPFDSESFDVCVTYNGLHCFPDPAAALAEMARVLKPGGALRGTSVVRGSGMRQDMFIRANQRAGTFGKVGTFDELRGWVEEAGFEAPELSRDGGLAYIAAAL
jgi:ubiquinone/menaquinone biosynthesis C-methylase UbiE